MTGTICVNKSQFVPVMFEPPCVSHVYLFRCLTYINTGNYFVNLRLVVYIVHIFGGIWIGLYRLYVVSEVGCLWILLRKHMRFTYCNWQNF